jgi:Leucine-rich repeat (LRR) protein
MKKLITLLIAGLLMLAACGGAPAPETPQDGSTTTTTPAIINQQGSPGTADCIQPEQKAPASILEEPPHFTTPPHVDKSNSLPDGRREFYLHQQGITDEKLVELTQDKEMLNNANVYYLSLFLNEISDISPLAKLTHITHLDLNRNQITDISPLFKLVNLQHLKLSENPLTESQIEELRAALPDCQIYF